MKPRMTLEALQAIKKEIEGEKYEGKSASEIACILNEQKSKEPKEFLTVKVDKVQAVTSKITADNVDSYIAKATTDGAIATKDLEDSQVEVLTTRKDEMGFNVIEQGDIEEALRI